MKLSDKDVLFEDNHLIIVKKPKGIPTQTSKEHSLSLEEIVKEYIKRKTEKQRVFLHTIYRLDRQVGGIVLLAKTSKALSRLNQQQREKKIKKIYRAVVNGKLFEKRKSLCHFLKKQEFMTKVYNESLPDTKKAELDYEVIKENPTTLLINLHTGRYHQIRAQLSYIGHPILGDEKYGGPPNKELLLDCVRIEFFHPTTNQLLCFQLD